MCVSQSNTGDKPSGEHQNVGDICAAERALVSSMLTGLDVILSTADFLKTILEVLRSVSGQSDELEKEVNEAILEQKESTPVKVSDDQGKECYLEEDLIDVANGVANRIAAVYVQNLGKKSVRDALFERIKGIVDLEVGRVKAQKKVEKKC